MATTIRSAATTLRAPGVEFEFDEAQLAAVSFLARVQRQDARGVPPRPPRLLPMDHRQPHRRARGESCAHRAVPRLDGGPRARRVNYRPSPLDVLWVLPVRAHRRTYPLEPRPVGPPTAGPSLGRSGAGSLGARGVPVHRGAVRPRSRRACRAAGVERATRQRGLCHQRRGWLDRYCSIGVVAQVESGGESNKASSAGSGAWNTHSQRSKSARWIG